MAKEWILNQAMNRWGLNKKTNVGPTSELIRKCAPRSVEQWGEYYYKNAYPRSHLEQLGRKLYVKVTEVCQAEIETITERDCIQYMVNMVINRTYDGYQSEIQTVYGQLRGALGVDIQPAPDEWDRLYNVDFYIAVEEHYIGLQIKPAGYANLPQIYKEMEFQRTSHHKFTRKYGGKVFYVISVKQGRNKVIQNPEVIEEIRGEMKRLAGQHE